MSDPQKRLRKLRRKMFLNILLFLALIGGSIWYVIHYVMPGDETVDRWGGTRKMDTPSGRLVGHWRFISAVEGDRLEHFFSNTDSGGTGTVYQLALEPERFVLKWRYRITREVRDGMPMDIEYLGPDNAVERRVKLVLPLDGMTAEYRYEFHGEPHLRTMEFVDRRVRPEPTPETTSESP